MSTHTGTHGHLVRDEHSAILDLVSCDCSPTLVTAGGPALQEVPCCSVLCCVPGEAGTVAATGAHGTPLGNEGLSFLSCLVALLRMSKTMLKSTGEERHPCLFPDLQEKAFSVISVDALYQLEKVPPYSCFSESFDQEWLFYFVKCLFYIN